MKIKVIKKFRDSLQAKKKDKLPPIVKAGTEMEVANGRGAMLIEKGYAVAVEPAKEADPKK